MKRMLTCRVQAREFVLELTTKGVDRSIFTEYEPTNSAPWRSLTKPIAINVYGSKSHTNDTGAGTNHSVGSGNILTYFFDSVIVFEKNSTLGGVRN